MQYGIHVPNFGEYGDPRLLVELAREAETAGWDGFFLWDHVHFDPRWRAPMVDPWIALAAIATATTRVRIGPLVTPLARRRPWIVAREVVTLDHLSNGRLVLGVGLGEPAEEDFAAFGEDPDPRVRAKKLDEGIAILLGLMSGESFSFSGEHYRLSEVTFLPRPVQRPRVPIWVGGAWPHRAPMRRAARLDGVFPDKLGVDWLKGEIMSPADLAEIVGFVRDARASLPGTGVSRGDAESRMNFSGHLRDSASPRETPVPDQFDVVLGGRTPADDRSAAVAIVEPYGEAGLTWWIEGLNGLRGPLEAMRERIRQGPPRR